MSTTLAEPTPSMQAGAAVLLEDPSRWTHARRNAAGRAVWIVRGRPGVYYTRHDACTCPGWQRRHLCSHSLAATMREARAAAQQARRFECPPAAATRPPSGPVACASAAPIGAGTSPPSWGCSRGRRTARAIAIPGRARRRGPGGGMHPLGSRRLEGDTHASAIPTIESTGSVARIPETCSERSVNSRTDGVNVLTARGATHLRLGKFRDLSAGLGPADRAYLAEGRRDLLVDAVVPEAA